jgi:hypothetical protein
VEIHWAKARRGVNTSDSYGPQHCLKAERAYKPFPTPHRERTRNFRTATAVEAVFETGIAQTLHAAAWKKNYYLSQEPTFKPAPSRNSGKPA